MNIYSGFEAMEIMAEIMDQQSAGFDVDVDELIAGMDFGDENDDAVEYSEKSREMVRRLIWDRHATMNQARSLKRLHIHSWRECVKEARAIHGRIMHIKRENPKLYREAQ